MGWAAKEMTVTPRALIDDLRSRINPAYAAMRGTESYERRLCAETLEAQANEIEHLRRTVAELSALAQHSDECSWITPLPTGEGYWGCDCGLDRLVLDGEPTDAALTPNQTAKRAP